MYMLDVLCIVIARIMELKGFCGPYKGAFYVHVYFYLYIPIYMSIIYMYAHTCTRTGTRCTHCVEVACSRFEPGNRLPCDVKVLLNPYNIFYCLRRLVSVCSAHFANSGLGLSAYQPFLLVCGDRITEWMSGGQ